MKNYNEVLNLFVSKDPNRRAMMSPFTCENYAVATDTHSMCFVDKSLLTDRLGPNLIDVPNTRSHLANEPNLHLEMSLISLEDALKKSAKQIEKIDRTCLDCKGDGYVYFIFTSADGEQYEKEDECPVCDGVGNIKNFDEKQLIRFNDQLFKYKYFNRLLNAAKLLECETIKITFQNNAYYQFEVGECRILITKLYIPEDSEGVFVTHLND